MLPGLLTVSIGANVRGGGALAVFAVVYFFSPAALVAHPRQSYAPVVEELPAQDSELAIVDISLLDNPDPESSEFPALDIKLRNRGDVAAFVKRARLEVLDRLPFESCEHYLTAEVSWTYDVNLDRPRPMQLSQVVPPGGVDRFAVVLGHDVEGAGERVFYRLKLFLEYDEDTKELSSKSFTVLLAGKGNALGSHSGGPRFRKCLDTLEEKLEPVQLWPVSYSLPDFFKDRRPQ